MPKYRLPFHCLALLVLLISTLAATTQPAGLVIVKAVYGDLSSDQKTDVTDKVKGMVKDDALTTDASNDNFGDPANGVRKDLQVDYTLNGIAHTRIVVEDATLVIDNKPSKLIITKAVWGDLPNGAKTDVTEKVAWHVNSDSLTVVANNAYFGDPASGVGKKLTVDYTFDGKALSKTVDEDETLTISDSGD